MKTTTFLLLLLSSFIISCSSDSKPCESNPCADSPIPNKTVCEAKGDNDFTCVCELGYELEGSLCKEKELSSCYPDNPCTDTNKTNCIVTGDGDNDYTCKCDSGYHSSNGNCIKTVNPCEPNPCTESLKTTCIANSQTEGDFTSKCDEGYSENSSGICEEVDDFNLRLVAANITSGNNQAYDWGEGIRIFQALKSDVVMIQELNYKDNETSDYKEFTAKVFDDPGCVEAKRCYFYAGSGQIPNGILSKYKILSKGYWDDPEISNRDLNYAVIDLPGSRDLFVVSVHLSTKGSKQTRPASIIAQKVAEHKRNNPGKFYYAVGGDFNGSTAVSSSGFGKENAFNIQDLFPKSKSGKYGTNASRKKHYDWILVNSTLSDLQVASKFCDPSNASDCLSYANGLVMDTREYTSSEIKKYFSPARLGDSGAVNMQHMAIVKDFKIVVE